MTTSTEDQLRDVLRHLADIGQPEALADRALVQATRLRRRNTALAGGAVVALAAAVAMPFALTGGGRGAPSAAIPSEAQACRIFTNDGESTGGVPRAEWPEFVLIAVADLPPRGDYTLQSGFGICPELFNLPDSSGRRSIVASAIVNLGPNRENGALTIDLFAHREVTSCAALPQAPRFCDEATASTPLVYGSGDETSPRVTAVYPDGRMAVIESLHGPFSFDDLKFVVTDRALADLIP